MGYLRFARVLGETAKAAARASFMLLAARVSAHAAATAGEWQYRTLGHGFAYDVLLPDGYTPEHSYPVILYLHGVGAQAPAGTPPYNAFPQMMNSISVAGVNYRARYPAIIVAPQCANAAAGTNDWGGLDVSLKHGRLTNPPMRCGDGAMAALKTVIATTSANPAKIYIVGFSLGGIGAYYLAATHPSLFAAILPVAGAIRGNITPAEFARFLRGKPMWSFHGFDDRTVPKTWDEALYDDSVRHQGKMKYTELIKPGDSTRYPSKLEPRNGDGHPNGDIAAFEAPETLDWLFKQSQ